MITGSDTTQVIKYSDPKSTIADTTKSQDRPKVSSAAADADIFSQGFQRFSTEIQRRQLDLEPEIQMILSSLGKLSDAAEKTVCHFEQTGDKTPALELNHWLFGMNHDIFTRDILVTDLMYLLELRDPVKAKSLAEVLNIGGIIQTKHGAGQAGNNATFLGIAHEELEEGFPAYRKIFRRDDPDKHSILPTMREILKQKKERSEHIDSFANGTMTTEEKLAFNKEQFVFYSKDDPTIMPSYYLASKLQRTPPAQYATLRQNYVDTRALRLATLMTHLEKINQREIYSAQNDQKNFSLVQKTLALFRPSQN